MKEPFIDMRLWRQFAALAEELHFGRAAQRLHMTQPPLTQAIAGLERTLGLKLFERTKRSVQLTPAGTALLPQVLDLLDRAQALPAHARAAAAGEVGRLRLAFVSTVGFGMLPQWVRAFRAQWPGVRLELIEATGDVQLQALGRGDIDAGLLLHTPGQAPPTLQNLCVAREPLVLAMPDRHPLAQQPVVHLRKLLSEPLVIFPRPILPSLYDAILALYHEAGREPTVAQEAIQMQTIVNLVSADLGVAWVPASVQQFQRPGVVYRQLGGRPTLAPVCETSLVWMASAVPPALARWIDFVSEQVALAQVKLQ
ncbi:MAG: LysR family transcriptional regulator [Gammaproteobacteria bacterium]|nr:LysR family transcriptional regulator [Gammaproteobacteria bacterium]MBU1508338.1 LysR family transcriptional regulator [Gammaproteobacteria bacterium]MBU2122161.1 LysR family transcriptional regulator [Gammaproteobacteria bacterium]MBU2169802.1 LysR family transcriptional regulator [Gammaproteobacteria bacterium]MBU2199646.1 LysR family transcriptional regulator [Gammaproteobacteria bacterium]